MTDANRSCRVCHAQTAPSVLGALEGEEKALKMAVQALTVLICPNGHRQFLRAEAPLELLDHLVERDEAALPHGEETGLPLFRHFRCEACGKDLQPKPDHRHTFTLEPGLPDQPGLKVDLTMPVYKCSGCGKEQLHSLKEVRKLTPAALAHAFQSAEIRSG